MALWDAIKRALGASSAPSAPSAIAEREDPGTPQEQFARLALGIVRSPNERAARLRFYLESWALLGSGQRQMGGRSRSSRARDTRCDVLPRRNDARSVPRSFAAFGRVRRDRHRHRDDVRDARTTTKMGQDGGRGLHSRGGLRRERASCDRDLRPQRAVPTSTQSHSRVAGGPADFRPRRLWKSSRGEHDLESMRPMTLL